MKRMFCLFLALLILGTLTVAACADAIVPDTPLDNMREAGGPLLLILTLIVGVVYLTSWLIRKLIKKIRSRK